MGTRAWYAATFVPPVLFRSEGKTCLARELLVRYGNREDVRRNLAANFSSEGWVGPSSLHYETKKKSMMEFRQAESDPNVRLWFDEFTESLGRAIERARVEEERDDF